LAFLRTIDERLGGGIIDLSAEELDAPEFINESFVLAEDSPGFGTLADISLGRDVDVYSL
jgi:hypothetical protein